MSIKKSCSSQEGLVFLTEFQNEIFSTYKANHFQTVHRDQFQENWIPKYEIGNNNTIGDKLLCCLQRFLHSFLYALSDFGEYLVIWHPFVFEMFILIQETKMNYSKNNSLRKETKLFVSTTPVGNLTKFVLS